MTGTSFQKIRVLQFSRTEPPPFGAAKITSGSNGAQTISVQFTLWSKHPALPSHPGALPWCVIPVCPSAGLLCTEHQWGTQITGQEGRPLRSDGSTNTVSSVASSVRPSRAERTVPGLQQYFISVRKQNFWPITASNPSDHTDDIILAPCGGCPVWEVGQDSFLGAALSERLSYGHPHNLCRKYFTLQIVFLKIPSQYCSFYPETCSGSSFSFPWGQHHSAAQSSHRETQSVRCRSVTGETAII